MEAETLAHNLRLISFTQELCLNKSSLDSDYACALLRFPFTSSEQAKTAFKNILSAGDVERLISQMRFVDSAEVPLEAPFTMRATKVAKNIVAQAESQNIFESQDFEYESSSYEESDDRVFDGNIIVENQDLWIKNKKILENASFTLVKGRIYGLVGKNGIGKSTLLRGIRKRRFDISKGLKMYLVKQEDRAKDSIVIDYVTGGVYDDYERIARAKKILKDLGFAVPSGDLMQKDTKNTQVAQNDDEISLRLDKSLNFSNRDKSSELVTGISIFTPLKNLSGGWNVRASLAKAFYESPQLLLLDEPTNMLDFPAIVWLEKAVKKLQTTVVIVSHDREFLNNVCTDILHLHDLHVTPYKGNYDAFVYHRTLALEKQQKEHEKQVEYRKHLQEFIDRFRYNSKRASLAQSKIKIMENMVIIPAVRYDPPIRFTFRSTAVSGTLIELKDAGYSYDTSRLILEHVDIKITSSSRIVVVGPNGAGKSTLLKIFAKRHDAGAGTAIFNPNLRVAYFTQHHIDQLDLNESVLEHFHKRSKLKDDEMRRIMSNFNLVADTQKIGTLSGGQKSRLAFSILSATEPNMLIMDEPTNHLDIESIDALAECLKKFSGPVIAVSHDLKFIESVFDEVWVCENQTLRYFKGSIRDYKNSLLNKNR